jgi:predicted nucleotidyltransferase
MQKQLDELLSKLTSAFGDRLISVVLYGSGATGELHDAYSDLNILCALGEITPAEIAAAEPIFRWWRELGSPSPLMMTPAEIGTSADSFPIEFHDIKEQSRLLHGADLMRDVLIDDRYYRAQVEYQLRAKLLRLRQKAGGVYSHKDLLLRLMAESVSTFCVLFRHALRLSGGQPEFKKHRIIDQAVAKFGIAGESFHKLLDLREGKVKEKETDAHALLGPYLYQIEEVIRIVDQLSRRHAERLP